MTTSDENPFRELKVSARDEGGVTVVSFAVRAQPRASRERIELVVDGALKVALTAVSALSKAEMSHNFVLLAKGTNVDAFAMDAAMARDNGYIPKAKASSILAQTKLAGGGETVEVTFNAPTEPGEYVYICSFPGHYLGGTKGKLIVK